MPDAETTPPQTQAQENPALARKPRPRWLRRLIIVVALAYVTWCTVLFFFQDRMLFPRDLAPPPLPRIPFSPTMEMYRDIPGGGGRIVAWLVRPGGPPPPSRWPLIIHFHGNAEIIDYQDFVVPGYQRLGCAVLLPEYRGYGRSAGIPSQSSLVDDAIWFRDQVANLPDIDSSRILIHGRSIGGAVAAQLAAARTPRGLILESTFTSVAGMARSYGVPSFLVKNAFRTDQVLPQFDIPILLMHGARDDIIPVDHSQSLLTLARKGTYVEFECMHNDFPGLGMEEKYWNAITQFLQITDMIPPPTR